MYCEIVTFIENCKLRIENFIIMSKKSLNKKPRVVVAMSGGVDSCVAAYLLKKQGYEVIGVFLKFWTPPVSVCGTSRENACCDMRALLLARQVAGQLDIPFYTVNVSSYFKKEIVDNFVHEYESGRTPNPCVRCNEKIKFGVLWKKARALGADYLATGHYVRKCQMSNIKYQKKSKISHLSFEIDSKFDICNLTFSLMRSKDVNKDQAYFLSGIDARIIPHLLFPLGDMVKKDVREIAKKAKLPVYNKKDSTGICFIPDGDTSSFLSHYSNKLNKSGNIVDKNGNVLGKHKGLMGYTVGEKIGGEIFNFQFSIFNQYSIPNIQDQKDKIKKDVPRLYVIRIDVKKNRLIIGENEDCFTDTLIAEDVNIIGSDLFTKKTILAQIRGGHKPERCHIVGAGISPARIKGRPQGSPLRVSKLNIKFLKPVRAVTPGQTVAFYDLKGKLLGGGIIK